MADFRPERRGADAPHPFRPERFVISSELAAELDDQGLAVSRVIQHADGTSELVLAPIETAQKELAQRFIDGCLRSGLTESVCRECGRPWLTRGQSTLCPVCDPSHCGFRPEGPLDRARWLNFWRASFTALLGARAANITARQRQFDDAGAMSVATVRPRRPLTDYAFELMARPWKPES